MASEPFQEDFLEKIVAINFGARAIRAEPKTEQAGILAGGYLGSNDYATSPTKLLVSLWFFLEDYALSSGPRVMSLVSNVNFGGASRVATALTLNEFSSQMQFAVVLRLVSGLVLDFMTPTTIVQSGFWHNVVGMVSCAGNGGTMQLLIDRQFTSYTMNTQISPPRLRLGSSDLSGNGTPVFAPTLGFYDTEGVATQRPGNLRFASFAVWVGKAPNLASPAVQNLFITPDKHRVGLGTAVKALGKPVIWQDGGLPKMLDNRGTGRDFTKFGSVTSIAGPTVAGQP